jgi:CMP-N-acetylneuraminic acid synthetase
MINGKTVLAVTLARGGSSKIPRKNITIVNGRPLLSYTTDEIKLSKYIDKYIVSTDDEDISIFCKYEGIESFKRSNKNATDAATSASALIEVINKLILNDYDYVVEIMCTNPLKIVDDIDGCINKLNETECDSVVSVCRVWAHHPSRIKYIENDKLVDFYPEVPESRRQDLKPAAYIRNGSIYATTMKSLLQTGIRLGKDTRAYIMPDERSINIDEPIDLIVARELIINRK